MILDLILAAAVVAAVLAAVHYRAAATAAKSVSSLSSSGISADLQGLRNALKELAEGGSLSTILKRVNAVGEQVVLLRKDVREPVPVLNAPVAPAAPNPVAPSAPDAPAAPVPAAEPAAEAEAASAHEVAAPSVGSGGTVEGTLSALEQQIATLQARKKKVEDAQRALQEALT